jgi:hypothetical protein
MANKRWLWHELVISSYYLCDFQGMQIARVLLPYGLLSILRENMSFVLRCECLQWKYPQPTYSPTNPCCEPPGVWRHMETPNMVQVIAHGWPWELFGSCLKRTCLGDILSSWRCWHHGTQLVWNEMTWTSWCILGTWYIEHGFHGVHVLQ